MEEVVKSIVQQWVHCEDLYDPANPENNHLGSKFGSLFAALAMWFFTALWVILPLLVKLNVIVFART